MGNEPSKSNSRLGVCAMAFTTKAIEAEEMKTVAGALNASGGGGDSGMCPKSEFDEALKTVEKFEESDLELFHKLFVMFDNTGEDTVPIREYLAGVGGCLCSGTVAEKLQLAFELYDLNGTGVSDRGNMKKVLNSINLVASYFGDPVVSTADIDKLVLETFQKANVTTAPLPFDTCVPLIVGNNIVERFVAGKGDVKFGR